MAAAAVACCTAVMVIAGPNSRGAVLLGMLGPLAAALASWTIVERVHGRAPGRVPGLMIRLFAAKLVLFGAYVAALALLLPAGNVAFVVSFTCHYILLHVMEAVYLQRLFGNAGQRWGVS
jgi:hypothetical protein